MLLLPLLAAELANRRLTDWLTGEAARWEMLESPSDSAHSPCSFPPLTITSVRSFARSLDKRRQQRRRRRRRRQRIKCLRQRHQKHHQQRQRASDAASAQTFATSSERINNKISKSSRFLRSRHSISPSAPQLGASHSDIRSPSTHTQTQTRTHTRHSIRPQHAKNTASKRHLDHHQPHSKQRIQSTQHKTQSTSKQPQQRKPIEPADTQEIIKAGCRTLFRLRGSRESGQNYTIKQSLVHARGRAAAHPWRLQPARPPPPRPPPSHHVVAPPPSQPPPQPEHHLHLQLL